MLTLALTLVLDQIVSTAVFGCSLCVSLVDGSAGDFFMFLSSFDMVDMLGRVAEDIYGIGSGASFSSFVGESAVCFVFQFVGVALEGIVDRVS